MLSNGIITKVLLPTTLLNTRESIPEQIFLNDVRKYLEKYTNYRLIDVVDSFAVCERLEVQKKGGRKRK
ncbi:hypothetical protein [Peribacillus tepidiphilus]|uniref:hypothetical protein n=1 Tax=Peribacillus tepidiphilus TaxID=2652445 RepID=UPI001291B1EC|nr:hypothetical protein [Peribacillus tepidiphilus]